MGPQLARRRRAHRRRAPARASLPSTDVWFAVLLEDGTLLLATERGRRLVAFDGATLDPRGDWLTLDHHARQVAALPSGGALVSTTDGVFTHPASAVLMGEHATLSVRPDGAVVLAARERVELRGPDLALRAALPLELEAGAGVVSVAVAGALAVAAVEGPRAAGAGTSPRGLLRLRLDGEVRLVQRSLVPTWGPSALAGVPALGPDGRAVLVEADVDPNGFEVDHTLVLDGPADSSVGPDAGASARRLWSVRVGDTLELRGSGPPPVPLALAPDGSCRVAIDGALRCFDPDGVPRWSRDTYGAWWVNGLVLDRDGVAYAPTHGGVAAWAADGARLFELRGSLRPLAIDARGRLLALRADERGADELLAIA